MTNTEIFTRRKCQTLRLLTNVLVPFVAVVACLAADALSTSHAQENEKRTNWKTGREFHEQLKTLTGVSWGGSNTLGRATGNLAESQGVAIFLDRRVDPDQEIEFAAQNTELWTLTQQLAKHVQQGVCRIGTTVYIGPPQTAYVLATVAATREEEVSKLVGPAARRLQRTRRLNWPELTQPRDLVRQLGESYDVQIVGIEQIPHDLWPEVDLPPLSFSQQMTVVLAGFDLTFSFEPAGAQVRLVQLPEKVSLQREYRLSANTKRIIEEIRQRFPAIQVAVNTGSVQVRARLEEHELIRQRLSGRPAPGKSPKPSSQDDQRYELAVENQPIGGVAAALAKNLGREIRYDPGVTNRLNELVSFKVENATLDDLFRAFLDPVGMSYQVGDKTLLIFPRRSD